MTQFNPFEKSAIFYQGQWQSSVANQTLDIINPCDESLVATIPVAHSDDTQMAIESASTALPLFRAKTATQRSELLGNIAQMMHKHTNHAIDLLATELGKPIAHARRDWELAIEQFEWYAAEIRNFHGHLIDSNLPNAHYQLTYEPVGVVVALTAWNFPPLLAARKIAPALAIGCPIILRPSIEAPGIVMLLVECCRLANVPEGMVNLVVGSLKDTYEVLMGDNRIRKISLTGSTDVGKQVAGDAAKMLKKVAMELGGNAPTIIFDDATDIEQLAATAVMFKHANAGQVCAAPDRFYVQQNIYDEFIEAYLEHVANIKVGNVLKDDTVTMGPLVNAKRLRTVESLLERSIAEGAKLLTGGRRLGNKGFFFSPTVLKDVSESNACSCEENFAPITSFSSFTDEKAVLACANNSEYGLASYLFTKDKARIQRMVSQLEAGMVAVNTFALASAQMPFGGIKQSGYGREGGNHTLIEYCNIKLSHHLIDG